MSRVLACNSTDPCAIFYPAQPAHPTRNLLAPKKYGTLQTSALSFALLRTCAAGGYRTGKGFLFSLVTNTPKNNVDYLCDIKMAPIMRTCAAGVRKARVVRYGYFQKKIKKICVRVESNPGTKPLYANALTTQRSAAIQDHTQFPTIITRNFFGTKSDGNNEYYTLYERFTFQKHALNAIQRKVLLLWKKRSICDHITFISAGKLAHLQKCKTSARPNR